jgi:hypothetical protein
MKRQMCIAFSQRFAKLVALALSFILMFTSVSTAGETRVSTMQEISASTNVENIFQAPTSEQNSLSSPDRFGECTTDNKEDGLFKLVKNGKRVCLPRKKLGCGECMSNGRYGYWIRATPTLTLCTECA